MTGACYNVALTCGYAVFAYDADIGAQVNAASTESERQMILIRAISDLFYQSLLCPTNSTFITDPYKKDNNGEYILDANGNKIKITASPNRTINGYVNTRCKCDEGYTVWGGACLGSCPSNQYRNTFGACTECETGYVASGATSGRVETENNTCIEAPSEEP